MSCERTLLVGHRANSLRKIRKYLAIGVPVIEMDIVEREGSIVLQHAEEQALTLPYTVSKYPFFRLGKLITSLTSVMYVRLVDALKLVSGKASVMLDLKATNIAEDLANVLRKSEFKGTIYVTSRYHRELKKIKNLLPHVRALLTLVHQPVDLIDYIRKANADGVSVDSVFIDEALINELHSYGYIVASWTVNDLDMASHLISLGVDLLVTDVPEKIMKEVCEIREIDERRLEENGGPLLLGGIEHLFGVEITKPEEEKRGSTEEEVRKESGNRAEEVE